MMQKIHLDISEKTLPQVVYAKQFDVGRKFIVALYDSGTPYTIPESATLSVGYAAADGKNAGKFSSAVASENTIEITIDEIMTSTAGNGVLSVTLLHENGNEISTWNIPYSIEMQPGSFPIAPSPNTVNLTKAVLFSAQKLTDAEKAQARKNIGVTESGGGGSGEDGFSPIATVTQTSDGALISITDKDGTTTATVTNGKDGSPGTPGADGTTPHIGGNGNWFIGNTDTGKPSRGATGEAGIDGSNGKDGTSVTVKSVSESTADGGSNVVTFSDGKIVTIKNGSKGSTGATGATGATGPKPVKGIDYFTEADKAEMVEYVKTAYAADSSWLDGYDIPKLYLTGDTAGMSKDVAVTLAWEYGENSGSCTLKWQGNSSLAYDKKNYTIKLDNAIDIGYGAQKKYVLKANYIDFSHARNIVSARIWGMMVASRKNIIGKLASSPNYGAINGFPVAIVLNGKFHGLYTFNIPKDGWMMNMGSGTQECILCADHSTATQFKGEASLVGETDFEVEYITDENNTAWAKTSVNRLINACINSNGGDLDTTVAQYLDWESAIDYYILVALLDGHDMTDKNYLLSTYDGTKWFFGAYDMDSTYGLKWDGSYFSKASYGDHTSFASYANTHRVMELIKRFKTNALKARYAELRADVLSESTIAREFERFACSIPSRLLDEDRNVWPMLPCTSVNNTFQILCWLNRRLAYVDKWVEELPAQEEPIGPSYTNVLTTAIDTDGNIYNGVGYKDDTRLSSLGSGGVEKTQAGSVQTGFIKLPFDETTGLIGNPIIRVKGVRLLPQSEAGYSCYFITYNKEFTLATYTTYDSFKSNAANCYSLTYDEATGVYTIDFSNVGNPQFAKYIRLNAVGKGADMIVTVNEEITD